MDLAFSTPQGNGGGGLAVHGRLTARGLTQGPWRISISLPKGQLLFSSWFFDLSQVPWKLSATLEKERGGLCLTRFHYRGLADLSLNGEEYSFQRGKGVLSFHGDAGLLYHSLVSEAFGEEAPILRHLSIKGEINGRLTYKRGSESFFSGLVSWSGEVKEGRICLQGALSIPLLYAPQGIQRGRLFLRHLTFGPFSVDHLEIPLKALPYKLFSEKVLTIPLWHGAISVGPFVIRYKDLRAPVAEIHGLLVHKLRPPKAPLPVEVEGCFSRVRITPEMIALEGKLKVRVAKGKVLVDKIWISRPFTPLMKIGCDVAFSHLDLSDLTKVTSFGRMTGFIKGYIHGLVVSHGQPEAFHLRIETQEVKGVRKRISLDAINSISVLGGGGPVSLFLPFFKEFNYRYLGLSCSLKNDVFTLHGLKRKGKVEYVVEKGGLVGVDVINRNPENSISFRDMIERLKRIRRENNGEKR